MHRKYTWLPLLALLLTLSLAIAACSARPTLEEEMEAAAEEPAADAKSDAAADAVESDATAADGGLEAPMLAEMVAAGELPPLEERLPAEPLVVEPFEAIGQYGGTWRRAFTGVKDYHAWARVNYDPVLRWAPNAGDPVQPGLAKDWSWNDEGTELTLFFREGLKWSDGEPWTVDDIIFWWEDIELDTNITASPHIEWTVDGEPMTLEKIDDYTIKFIFPGPSGIVETMGLAFHGHQWPLGFERFGVFAPRHYLEQFHPTYNADSDYAQFEEMAFDYNIERPVIWAWKPAEWSPGATEMVLERNPYYWKVDPEGHQLPYIDRVHMSLVEDGESVAVLAAAGELDMQSRHLSLDKLPVLKENEEAGDYTVSLWSSDGASSVALQPNLSYGDPQYRELLQDVNFRYALSLAVDRDLVNDIAFLGQATPTTQSVGPATSWYVDDMAMFMGEYDVAEAQRLLEEEVGLVMGDDGFYDFADGTDLTLVVESSSTSGPSLDALELIVEGYNDMGLATTLKTMNRDLYWPRAIGNEVMINVWGTGSIFPLMNPDNLLAFNEKSFWAPQYGIWYQTGGISGEEPPEYIRTGQEIYDEILRTVDAEAQAELGKELVRNSMENMWVINVAGRSPVPLLVKNNFKNVWTGPDYTASWITMTPGNQNPATYYIEQE